MHNRLSNNYTDHPVYQRLMSSGPKRILALDGGGIRGALSLGFLERIESILRLRYKDDNFVLADYYDLIGGTSTGGIIATLLALGKSVSEVKELYLSLGEKIFSKKYKPWVKGLLRYNLRAEYDHRILEEAIGEYFDKTYPGEQITLGNSHFRSGLVIFTKRADTYSIWGFHNHPRNAFYEQNKGIHIEDLLRATSAAPSYFAPKEIVFGDGESAVFIDGGVSMVNHPGLMLFLMSTISGYGYQWKKGADHLMITSVGTGYHKSKAQKSAKEALLKRPIKAWAQEVPEMFMIDASEQNQLLLQYLSYPTLPQVINLEAGDLSQDLLANEPSVTYCRYNALIDRGNLAHHGFNMTEEDIIELRKMENGHNAPLLNEIGTKEADIQVCEDHLPLVFDYSTKHHQPVILDQDKAKELFLPLIQTHGDLYAKYGRVKAIISDRTHSITSITTHGIETTNQAHPGDYILTNLTSQKERHVLTEEKFVKRYRLIRHLDDGSAEYHPIGQVSAIQIEKDILSKSKLPPHFQIIPDWGSPQYVGRGDYLVCPLDESEVYRIGMEEFGETYQIKK